MNPTDNPQATYWNNRYIQKQTGWDIGAVSTPLKTYIDSLADKKQRILLPGCGNSYEAAYLLEKGFSAITLIDISQILTSQLEQKFKPVLNKALTLITGDFFDFHGQFDLILEQTFFCALPPARRPDYARKMHELLAVEGKLAGVLFNRAFESGPPFGGDEAEYRKLFNPYFVLEKLEPCYNSIPARAGTELFIQFRKA